MFIHKKTIFFWYKHQKENSSAENDEWNSVEGRTLKDSIQIQHPKIPGFSDSIKYSVNGDQQLHKN